MAWFPFEQATVFARSCRRYTWFLTVNADGCSPLKHHTAHMHHQRTAWTHAGETTILVLLGSLCGFVFFCFPIVPHLLDAAHIARLDVQVLVADAEAKVAAEKAGRSSTASAVW